MLNAVPLRATALPVHSSQPDTYRCPPAGRIDREFRRSEDNAEWFDPPPRAARFPLVSPWDGATITQTSTSSVRVAGIQTHTGEIRRRGRQSRALTGGRRTS